MELGEVSSCLRAQTSADPSNDFPKLLSRTGSKTWLHTSKPPLWRTHFSLVTSSQKLQNPPQTSSTYIQMHKAVGNILNSNPDSGHLLYKNAVCIAFNSSTKLASKWIQEQSFWEGNPVPERKASHVFSHLEMLAWDIQASVFCLECPHQK